ncbi:MAG: hypothetical protein JSV96_06690 [Candidatus Aminicenantes bacterium]|nr:MAG: hypothetical protein JSV96_06690 [Candidatus Aminicenantes bacterium]
MKFGRGISDFGLFLCKIVLIILLVTSTGVSRAQRKEGTANILIWDTLSPFVNTVDLRDRSKWKPVPTDLLTLELDPSAAFSDPGYYGREYTFRGDVIVENEHLIAVFWLGKARVAIYTKADSNEKRIEFVPLQLKGAPARITSCSILQNTGDEAALEISFSARKTRENLSAIVSFSKSEIVEIKPAESMKGISLLGPVEYGIVPSFIGDDLIFNPREYPSMNRLCIPSENLFLGLLKGGNNVLVVTWPEGKQQMKLVLDNEQAEPRLIESVDFSNDGKSIYLAILSAPGIWHKEQLLPSYLERDVAINWKRPFPAKWITQLYEAGVKTTFTFRESRDNIWRGVIGRYTYPVWFGGEKVFYRLSKKIPPKGESLIYFLERRDTPVSVSTPVDIMKETLGRQTCEAILDLEGRKLRSHHRRGGAGVRRAATCGCTEAIQVVFEAGQEVEKKEYVEGAVDDMVFFVTRHVERINEYQDFAREMMNFLNLNRQSNPDMKSFIDNMEAITQEILQEYNRQRENMKTLEYADELAHKTKALTQKKDPGNLSAYMDLSGKWRGMGGAQDELIAKSHSLPRKLFQEAGYSCVNRPQAVEIAQEIRRRCRRCLRNPDGYEIWPDY